MSSGLITYICVGPSRLPESGDIFNAAVARAIEVLDGLAEWNSPELYDLEGFKIPACIAAKSIDFEDWNFLLGEDADKIVEDFVKVWNDGYADDTTSREYQNQKILVAGDVTWGDLPNGHGYQLCRKAEMLGLFEIFSIE